jgi:predicted GNAT superfamily acetyltransferase
VEIEIRDFDKPSDYEACARLQTDVWGFSDADAVPPLHLIALHHYGGTLIGAFEGSRMVGFVCGFSGFRGGRVFHHSHMLAVVPEFRGAGLGETLKWAQRDRVLAMGIELVNWTFDPLQAVNANLNIQRLGAIARKYRVNVYGESQSPLHGGIPTDRLEAEWHIRSSRVVEARTEGLPDWPEWFDLPRANRTEKSSTGLLRSTDTPDLDLSAEALLVEIPKNITDVMAKDSELALDWRLKMRRLFQHYFEKGYVVRGFHRSDLGAFYRLESEEVPLD